MAEGVSKEYTLETLAGWWPEFHLVGTLPAYGLYLRHVDGLNMNGIEIHTAEPDERPALVLDDVLHARGSRILSNHQEIVLEP